MACPNLHIQIWTPARTSRPLMSVVVCVKYKLILIMNSIILQFSPSSIPGHLINCQFLRAKLSLILSSFNKVIIGSPIWLILLVSINRSIKQIISKGHGPVILNCFNFPAQLLSPPIILKANEHGPFGKKAWPRTDPTTIKNPLSDYYYLNLGAIPIIYSQIYTIQYIF